MYSQSDKASSSNDNMTNHRSAEIFIKKVKVDPKKLNLEQLVRIDEGCTDSYIDSDTAKDIYDYIEDSEYFEIIDNLVKDVETKDVKTDLIEDDSAETTEDNLAEETMDINDELTDFDLAEETVDNSVEKTEDNSAEETEVTSGEETEDNSAEETDEEDIIEVDGKKGKLIAINLSVQEARDFFDDL